MINIYVVNLNNSFLDLEYTDLVLVAKDVSQAREDLVTWAVDELGWEKKHLSYTIWSSNPVDKTSPQMIYRKDAEVFSYYR